ncbi:alpha/beta fold hydrolase [Luteimonas gilva]|uniref:Alpha/beta fold hydrolase n=1 Tax=Luteimonas gilva TaxID=2572684 RepID=A0A4U5JLU9_9GAMM|nr:alpha/beta fold hydrolase [Luteimonas gilva]TKR29501.1 alpha/beta fold hydrolase [Luteimonas gilva]
MNGSVLFIHGGGTGAYAADRALADSLQRALGAGWEVDSPPMPDEENCPYPEWRAVIDARIASMKGPVMLVGHSVGGSVLLKYLCERRSTPRIAGLFAVASPYWGTGGWNWDELALPADAAKRLTGDWPLVLYYSRDDEVVPFSHLALYTAKLPRAAVREYEGRDHQFGEDLTDVAADILRTATRKA